MKTCFKCGVPKEESEFYKHPQMADGLLGKCKECTKKDSTKNRSSNLEYYRKYDRNRGNRQDSGYVSSYRKNNPRRYAANTLLGNAVRDGKVKRKPCERCGSVRSHGHHENYDCPLDVMWLCAAHHRERHKELAQLGIQP